MEDDLSLQASFTEDVVLADSSQLPAPGPFGSPNFTGLSQEQMDDIEAGNSTANLASNSPYIEGEGEKYGGGDESRKKAEIAVPIVVVVALVAVLAGLGYHFRYEISDLWYYHGGGRKCVGLLPKTARPSDDWGNGYRHTTSRSLDKLTESYGFSSAKVKQNQ